MLQQEDKSSNPIIVAAANAIADKVRLRASDGELTTCCAGHNKPCDKLVKRHHNSRGRRELECIERPAGTSLLEKFVAHQDVGDAVTV